MVLILFCEIFCQRTKTNFVWFKQTKGNSDTIRVFAPVRFNAAALIEWVDSRMQASSDLKAAYGEQQAASSRAAETVIACQKRLLAQLKDKSPAVELDRSQKLLSFALNAALEYSGRVAAARAEALAVANTASALLCLVFEGYAWQRQLYRNAIGAVEKSNGTDNSSEYVERLWSTLEAHTTATPIDVDEPSQVSRHFLKHVNALSSLLADETGKPAVKKPHIRSAGLATTFQAFLDHLTRVSVATVRVASQRGDVPAEQ